MAEAGGYEGEAKQAECDVLKNSQELDARSTFLVNKVSGEWLESCSTWLKWGQSADLRLHDTYCHSLQQR